MRGASFHESSSSSKVARAVILFVASTGMKLSMMSFLRDTKSSVRAPSSSNETRRRRRQIHTEIRRHPENVRQQLNVGCSVTIKLGFLLLFQLDILKINCRLNRIIIAPSWVKLRLSRGVASGVFLTGGGGKVGGVGQGERVWPGGGGGVGEASLEL